MANARVENAALTLNELPFSTTLSLKYAYAKEAAVTDRDGNFTLWVLPGKSVSLVIFAEDYGRKVLPNVPASGNSESLLTVNLEPGGSVEVFVDLPPEELSQGIWWVELRPLTRPEDEESGHEEEMGDLQQELRSASLFPALFSSKVPPDGWVRFASVLPGTYSVHCTTLPERLLRKTGWKQPEVVPFRPSASTGPLYVPPRGLQSVVLAPPRARLEVTIGGMPKEQAETLAPWVWLPSSSYVAKAQWQNLAEDRARFQAILEDRGVWFFGVRPSKPTGTALVPALTLGKVTVVPGQKMAAAKAAFNASPLSLEVVDQRGLPVVATVSVTTTDLCSGFNFSWEDNTDAQGRMLLPLVPKKPLTIWSYFYGKGASAYLEVDEPGVYRLEGKPGKNVSFLLRDEKGRPVWDGVSVRFRPLKGRELSVATPSQEGEVRIEGLPEVDGELLVVDLSPEGQKAHAPIRIRLEAKKRGYLGSFRLEKGGGLRWWDLDRSFLQDAPMVLLEREGAFYRFPVSVESFATGDYPKPESGVLNFRSRNLPPGRYRVVAVDEECRPLRYSKPFWIQSGRITTRKD